MSADPKKELYNEVLEATRNLNRSYLDAVNKRNAIMRKMNELEIMLGGSEGPTSELYLLKLKSASSQLNDLCDSLCLISKKHTEKVRELEEKAKDVGFELSTLESAKITAKKLEEVASDLLCYSLGR